MKRLVLAAVLTGLMSVPSSAQAQIVVGPLGPPRFRAVFPAAGVGFSYQRRGLWVGGFAGGFFSRSFFVAPAFAFPPFGFGPFGFGPGCGWGFGLPFGWNLPFAFGDFVPFGWLGLNPVFGPPAAFVPPAVFIPPGLFVGNADGEGLPDRNAGREAVVVAPARPARSVPPAPQAPLRSGEFLVIEPKKKVAPAAPAEFPPAAAAVVAGAAGPPHERVVPVARPVFAFDPFAPAWLVEAEKREADPEKEVARLLKLGREAFAAGEYGRAAEAFERAAAAGPRAPEPRFLKAQAAFAAGTYADAVAAIRAGLELEPHWPEKAFDPKEPYGANAAAFARHLAELRKAVAANPDEPTLAFLLGYQLWFVGEKAEAKRWLGIAAGDHPPAGLLALFR